MTKFLLLIFATVLLNANSLYIHKGWGMYSFGKEVKDINSIFNNRKEGMLFKFEDSKWKTFDFSKSSNSFNSISSNQGFWLFTESEQYINNLESASKTTLNITKGWNLYGMSGAVSDVFKTFTIQSNILDIWSYMPSCKSWKKNNSKVQEIDTLASYEGFWLNSKKAFSLEVKHESKNLLSSWNISKNGVSIYTECTEPLTILFDESTKDGSTANTMYLNLDGVERAGVPFPSKYINEKFEVIYRFAKYYGEFSNGTVNVKRVVSK